MIFALVVTLSALLARAQGSNATGDTSPTLLAPNGDILEDYVTYYLFDNETVELFCRGKANELRVMCESPYDAVYSHEIHSTELVNETTIRIFMENLNHSYTSCDCQQGGYGGKSFQVYHDVLPQVRDFGCVSLDELFINCSWTPSNVYYTYQLYYVKNGEPTLKCVGDGPNQLNYCSWHASRTERFSHDRFRLKRTEEHTFLVTSCGHERCFNQTFVYERFSIVKPNPVRYFEMNHNPFTPYQVELTWMSDCLYTDERNLRFIFKVQYWLPGSELHEVDTSSLDRQTGCYHKFDLNLPCADTQYEVRVAVKPASALGDKYWSDYSKIDVHTVKDTKNTTVVNPICKVQPRYTSDVMLYKIKELRNQFGREQQKIRETITSISERYTRRTPFSSDLKV